MLKLDKTALWFNRNPQIGLTVGRYGGQGFTTAALSARHQQQQRCVGCMAIVQQVGVHGQEGGGVRLCGSRRGASQSDFVPVTSGGPRQLPLANNPTAL